MPGATSEEALEAFQYLARLEGIIPALESAHAVAAAREVAKELGPEPPRRSRPSRTRT